MRYATLLAASALLALACSSAQAQWKWRDAGGHVTASDLPPPASVPEQNIIARPSDAKRASAGASLAPTPSNAPLSSAVGKAPATAAAPGKNSTDPELEARRKRAAEELAAQQRQIEASNAAARADNCARAKSYLGVLNEGQRVSRTTAQGEVEVVDDRGRAEELQRARSMIASECK